MSAGKRYKFHGTLFQVVTGFASDSPPQTITAVTKANPAVVTSNAHGLSDGDVIRITGAIGMVEINDQVFVVSDADDNTFALTGVDSRSFGTYSGSAEIEFGTLSQFCELTNYNRQGGSKSETEVTSACSDATEYELGMPDYGTTQIDYNFAPQVTVQAAIQALYDSGDLTGVKVTLPNDGGSMVQLGYVQSTSEQAGRGGVWLGSLTMRNTGTRMDFAAEVA